MWEDGEVVTPSKEVPFAEDGIESDRRDAVRFLEGSAMKDRLHCGALGAFELHPSFEEGVVVNVP